MCEKQLSFSQSLNKCLDCGASLSRPVRFDLCPANPSVTFSFGLGHRCAMRVSTSDGRRCDFSANKLTIWISYMSFCNFNSKSDGLFFHLISALPFPLQNLVQRHRPQTPSSVSSTPNEVSAIPCELFGNPLRALFLKNRDFSGTVKFSS